MHKNKAWLREQYYTNKLSLSQIAKLANVGYSVIMYYMKKYKLPLRSRSDGRKLRWQATERLYKNEKWLRKQYCNKQLSAPQIATLAKCSSNSILRWLERFGIPRRSPGIAVGTPRGDKKLLLYCNKKWLYDRYNKDKLTVPQIAELAGCNPQTIRRRMALYRLPIPSYTEAMLRRWKRGDFQDTWDNKARKKLSIAIKKRHAEGRYAGTFQSPTSIEIAVDKALDELNLPHTPEYVIPGRGYRYDQLVHPNTFIEVQGDYWHSSEKVIANDAQKAKWASQNGYRVIPIWEHEIRAQDTKQLVIEKLSMGEQDQTTFLP